MLLRLPGFVVAALTVVVAAAALILLWKFRVGSTETTTGASGAAETARDDTIDVPRLFLACDRLEDDRALMDCLAQDEPSQVGPVLLEELRKDGRDVPAEQRPLYRELLLQTGARVYGAQAWLQRLSDLDPVPWAAARWLAEHMTPAQLANVVARNNRYEPLVFASVHTLQQPAFDELMAALVEDQKVLGLADLSARGSLGMGRLRAVRGDESASELLLQKALSVADDAQRRAALDALPAEWKQRALEQAAKSPEQKLPRFLDDLIALPADSIPDELPQRAMEAAQNAHLEARGLALLLKIAAQNRSPWKATAAVWQPLGDDVIEAAWQHLDPVTQAHLLYDAAAASAAAPQDPDLERLAQIGDDVLQAFVAARFAQPPRPRDLAPYPVDDWPKVDEAPANAPPALTNLVAGLAKLRPSLAGQARDESATPH